MTLKTISEFMEREHSILISQWEDFLKEKNSEKAKVFLKKFTESLLRHMHLEDGELSPTFNKYLKIDKSSGPSYVMSNDHVHLLKLLNKVEEATESSDDDKFTYATNHFDRALRKHHKREEAMHYVFFDKFIRESEWEDMIKGKL